MLPISHPKSIPPKHAIQKSVTSFYQIICQQALWTCVGASSSPSEVAALNHPIVTQRSAFVSFSFLTGDIQPQIYHVPEQARANTRQPEQVNSDPLQNTIRVTSTDRKSQAGHYWSLVDSA